MSRTGPPSRGVKHSRRLAQHGEERGSERGDEVAPAGAGRPARRERLAQVDRRARVAAPGAPGRLVEAVHRGGGIAEVEVDEERRVAEDRPASGAAPPGRARQRWAVPAIFRPKATRSKRPPQKEPAASPAGGNAEAGERGGEGAAERGVGRLEGADGVRRRAEGEAQQHDPGPWGTAVPPDSRRTTGQPSRPSAAPAAAKRGSRASARATTGSARSPRRAPSQARRPAHGLEERGVGRDARAVERPCPIVDDPPGGEGEGLRFARNSWPKRSRYAICALGGVGAARGRGPPASRSARRRRCPSRSGMPSSVLTSASRWQRSVVSVQPRPSARQARSAFCTDG